MLYRQREDNKIVFYFSGLPIIDVLECVPYEYLISELYFMASNYKHEYIFAQDFEKVETISDIVIFLKTNLEYSIDDMNAILQNNIGIYIHDDMEISFLFPADFSYKSLINKILTNNSFDSEIIFNYLQQHKNLYIKIKQPNIIEKIYNNFEEYYNEN